MCNPAFAPAITGAFAGTLKAGAENSAAMAAWRWKKNLEEFGTDNALDAMRTQYTQTALKQGQERMSRGQELAMIAKKAAAVKAAATVRAAKGGVSGASVDALQNQFEKDARESMGIRVVEGEWADAMTEQRRTAIRQQAQSRIEAVQAPPEPSSAGRFMNTLTQAISGAIQAHQMTSGIEPATTTTLPDSPLPSFDPTFNPTANMANGVSSMPLGAHLAAPMAAPMATAGAIAPAYGKIATLGTTGANSIFPSANLGSPLSPLPPSAVPSALTVNNPIGAPLSPPPTLSFAPSAGGTGMFSNRPFRPIDLDYPSAFYQNSPLSIGGYY